MIFHKYILSIIILFSSAAAITSLSNEKTAVFVVTSEDSFINKMRFNAWGNINKTKDNIHIFADPSAQAQIRSLRAVKHLVSEDKLSQTIKKVMNNTPANRLILFINTHGNISGNWCYKNKNSCKLTEDFLINILYNNKFDHVLVVPLSCFNKKIMERFSSKLAYEPQKSKLSYIQQKTENECMAYSPAHSLINNLVQSFEQVNARHIDQFLGVSSLGELIKFNNNLLGEDLSDTLHYELKASHDINLSDFGFDIKLEKIIFSAPNDPVLYPYGQAIKDILNGLLEQRFFRHVESLKFYFAEKEESESDLIYLNGALSKNISLAKNKNNKYSLLSVILGRIGI